MSETKAKMGKWGYMASCKQFAAAAMEGPAAGSTLKDLPEGAVAGSTERRRLQLLLENLTEADLRFFEGLVQLLADPDCARQLMEFRQGKAGLLYETDDEGFMLMSTTPSFGGN